jgi:N-acetylglucosaminyldiphosphoundecaprenol N-acetyl-beta-D-mannosaminyltransferase
MIDILNIPIFDQNIETVVKEVCSIILHNQHKSNRCISLTGAHDLVYAKKNETYEKILKNYYLNLPDGMPLVWIGWLKNAKQIERCYGPDLFKALIGYSADKPITHYLCGGNEGVADELKTVCKNKYENNNIVGTYTPPFRDMTDDELKYLSEDINSKNVDIVWIGLSAPKGVILANKLSKYTNVHFYFSIGAAYDFHTGRLKQAPKILQKMGLEWFFRLCKEPRRLYKRYVRIVPLFIYYNIKELISYRIKISL